MNTRTMEILVACGRRILRHSPVETWDRATQDAVERALLDRSDGDGAIEAAVRAGREEWVDTGAFTGWLQRMTESGGIR